MSERIRVSGQIKGVYGAYCAIRVYRRDARGSGSRLRHADISGVGYYLAVEVGWRHIVAVYQRKPADSGAHERFKHRAAHSADSEKRNVRSGKPPDGFLSQ